MPCSIHALFMHTCANNVSCFDVILQVLRTFMEKKMSLIFLLQVRVFMNMKMPVLCMSGNHNVLRSSGISRKLGALIVRYSQKKKCISFVFYCFQNLSIAITLDPLVCFRWGFQQNVPLLIRTSIKYKTENVTCSTSKLISSD